MPKASKSSAQEEAQVSTQQEAIETSQEELPSSDQERDSKVTLKPPRQQPQVVPSMFMPYIEGPKMDWTVNDGLYHRFLKRHLKCENILECELAALPERQQCKKVKEKGPKLITSKEMIMQEYPDVFQTAKILQWDIFWFFLRDEEFVSKTISDGGVDLEKFPASKVRQLAKKLESSKATACHIKGLASSWDQIITSSLIQAYLPNKHLVDQSPYI